MFLSSSKDTLTLIHIPSQPRAAADPLYVSVDLPLPRHLSDLTRRVAFVFRFLVERAMSGCVPVPAHTRTCFILVNDIQQNIG